MAKNKKLKSYRKAQEIKYFKYYFSKEKNVFIYSIECIKTLFMRPSLLFASGSHFISGYPGSGKTLLMNHIINNVDKDKYFFYTNIDEFNQENVFLLDIKKLFNNKKQQFKLKTKIGNRQLYGVIFDEINFNFNRRVNMSKEYNDVFVPLVDFIVSHRHQGIPRIYFIGQKLELQDTQLISLFKYQHDIFKTKRRFRYWKYYESFTQKIPVKIKILHRIKDVNDQFIDISKDKIKFTWQDLTTYDTFALKKLFNDLKDYPISPNQNTLFTKQKE